MRVGVVLVDPQRAVSADPIALDLLGCASVGDLSSEEPIRNALQKLVGQGSKDWAPWSTGLGPDSKELRCSVSQVAGEAGRTTYFISLMDGREFEALLTDFRHATQWRDLGTLLPILGHDVRAPLNGLVINLELMKELLKPGASEDEQALARRDRALGALGRAVSELRKALDTLLANASSSVDVAGSVDLRELIQGVAFLAASQATVQHVSFHPDLPEQSVQVHGVRAHLRLAVINLLLNALESMPQGGDLKLSLERTGNDAVVSVVDSGPGIPEELRTRISGRHLGANSKGTGIGLFVTKNIAEAHGGSVRLHSTSGGGTRAELLLPAENPGR